ncbi:hypothetical protein ABBQ38_005599 [Trebouxia sp. C0009 RCD-2024]
MSACIVSQLALIPTPRFFGSVGIRRTNYLPGFQRRLTGSRPLSVTALHIDRRQHLELAWQRQQGEDELLKVPITLAGSTVIEVRSLAHLDQIVEGAGSAIVLLYLYSKSCGSCKEVLRHCSQLCHENSQQKGGVLFLKHNIWNDFDDLTDVARMYKAKAVPSFIFLTGGAMVSSFQTLLDVVCNFTQLI